MKNCLICSKSFETKRNPEQKCCSRSCNAKLHNRMLASRFICPKCLICGKDTKRQTGRMYCSLKCKGISRRGEKHPLWKGGIRSQSEGYIYIFNPQHPLHGSGGYVLEHRLVMEKHLGRYLTKQEVVHHINNKKNDNRIENLLLLSGQDEHLAVHQFLKKFRRIKNQVFVKSEELLETPSGQSAA